MIFQPDVVKIKQAAWGQKCLQGIRGISPCFRMRFDPLAMITVLMLISSPESTAYPASSSKTIAVFVALADNNHQGIVPVSPVLGDGRDLRNNLYWGAAEGLKGHFDKNPNWALTSQSLTGSSGAILEIRNYRHAATGTMLVAYAYEGSAIRSCIRDFEAAIQKGSHDLVAYIGHNGLMDFDLPIPKGNFSSERSADCIVLCCQSNAYFAERIARAGGRPVLLTTQLMYPGSFILSAVLEPWLKGQSPAANRMAAAAAYAANQGISLKSALGVFAPLEDPLPKPVSR